MKFIHGHGRRGNMSPTYNSWRQMRSRCLYPGNDTNKKNNYRERGITVCERWDSFENFLADMGERPNGRSLERKDSNGNYEPSNCCWATQKEQVNNKRNNHRITVGEETLNITEWSTRTGMAESTIRGRLKCGWSAEKAIFSRAWEAHKMKTAEKKWELPAEKVKILRWVEKQILAEPKRFDMDDLITIYDKEMVKTHPNLPKCGTVGCIAGWYTLKAKGKLLKDGFWVAPIENAWGFAAKELGLDYQGASRLFLTEQWPQPFFADWEDTYGDPEKQVKVAVKRIEHFIETGE